jgi:hypothetical protein
MTLAEVSARYTKTERPVNRRVSVASCWSLWHANSSSLSGRYAEIGRVPAGAVSGMTKHATLETAAA